MICRICNTTYEKWIPGGEVENRLCPECNRAEWDKFDNEHKGDYELMATLRARGHSRHCACRQVFGDGECECDLYKKGYDPYGWMKNYKRKEK